MSKKTPNTITIPQSFIVTPKPFIAIILKSSMCIFMCGNSKCYVYKFIPTMKIKAELSALYCICVKKALCFKLCDGTWVILNAQTLSKKIGHDIAKLPAGLRIQRYKGITS